MKVILAVDDSPNSKEVLVSVENRDWPPDTEFKVLTVLDPLNLSENLDNVIDGLKQKRMKAAEHLCKEVREQLAATIPGAIVHYEIRSGYPKAEIIDAAVEWSADRILLGAHGKRGCPHNLLGSVSRAVAAHAPCSVEIIREKTTRASKPRMETAAKAEV